MLGVRFVGEIYTDEKRLTDPNGWLTGVADNNKRQVIKWLSHYIESTLVPKWIAEHKVEFHILDRETNETIII